MKGKRFGRLVVLRENGRIRRKTVWLCKCDCGTQKNITSDHLVSGDTVSCSCYNRELLSKTNGKDLSGRKFNHLVAIKKIGKKNTYLTWLCKCDCGKYSEVSSTNLLTSNTESCGCRRKINQRKGFEWESLVKMVIHYKFPNVIYHKRLPNNSIPDFIVEPMKLILDAKRHDYLKIEECIDKYSLFCEKIIFICMERKRNNWKNDFKNKGTIEFWYPEDLLKWIPIEEQNKFFTEIDKIKSIWINEKNTEKEIIIEKIVSDLEKEGKEINQKNIAKKLGISKKTLRETSNVSIYLENFRHSQKEREEQKMIEKLKKIIDDKINNGHRIMTQDIARILLKSQKKHLEAISEREVWSLAKKLSTNKTYNDYISNEQKKLEESRKNIIKKVIEELKNQNEKITILKIRTTSGLPKNYLYSDEIKFYIDSLI